MRQKIFNVMWAPYVYSLFETPYTAAHRFGTVKMVVNGAFMQVDVNDNFFENDVVCTMLLLKTEGGNIHFSKYPAMCKCGLGASTSLAFPINILRCNHKAGKIEITRNLNK